jgi:tetratricopeptide (TPR) repeat protein
MRQIYVTMAIALAFAACDRPDVESAGPPAAQAGQFAVAPLAGELAHVYRLIERGDTGPARIRIRNWMDTNGEDAQALFLFGLAYHHERRYATSSAWFEQSLHATPAYPPAAHFLGWSAYYLGDSTTSSEAFRLHLSMSPDEGDSHYGLGLLALDAGELDTAHQCFTRAIELQHQQPDRIDGISKAMVRLAELEALHGNRIAARAHLEQAVAIDPDRIEGWHRLSRCCRRLGDDEAAAEAERQHAIAIQRVRPRGGFPE